MTMKPLTKEGIFECGLLELAPGKLKALTATVQPNGMGLGLAVANEPGYYPVPLHWCNGDNYDELADHATALNKELFDLDEKAALAITCSSMAASNKAKKKDDPVKAAFQLGYADATTGRGESSNPFYPENTPESEAYEEGFNEGQLYLEDKRCEALELGDDA